MNRMGDDRIPSRIFGMCKANVFEMRASVAPTKPDINKTRDAAVDFAKDLLMHDFAPLLEDLENRRHESEKRKAFYRFVVALHAARREAEEFRKAHVAEKRHDLRFEMDAQFQERLREIEAMTPGEEPRGVS